VALGIPSYVSRIHFDLVVYHYTFFALKWDFNKFEKLEKRYSRLKYVRGYKIAIPQDEYIYSDAVNDFFRSFGIKMVFTCLPESEYQKVYPREKSGLEHYVTVTTGYVDELAVEEIAQRVSKDTKRPIDIGYRARKVPYWLGRHGTIKWQVGERIRNAAKARGLDVDISCEPKDVFVGREWYRFLQRSRVFLGCEGGASLHDATGEIRQKVEQYVQQHPDAPFEEVEAACFPGMDGNLRLFAISPRHYECCITKTCQALVEGEYNGIFKPDIHYIEIKRNWSNINEVLKKIEDVEYCKQIAENAYRDIVHSGLYTYRRFVQKILEHINEVADIEHSTTSNDAIYLRLLQLREQMMLFGGYLLSPYYKIRSIAGEWKHLVINNHLRKT
jgi:hypothetical protein